jgi:hypothetical protein
LAKRTQLGVIIFERAGIAFLMKEWPGTLSPLAARVQFHTSQGRNHHTMACATMAAPRKD